MTLQDKVEIDVLIHSNKKVRTFSFIAIDNSTLVESTCSFEYWNEYQV